MVIVPDRDKNNFTIGSSCATGMCVFFLALQPAGRYVLVAASNRDEFFERKTALAEFWGDIPNILAGKCI